MRDFLLSIGAAQWVLPAMLCWPMLAALLVRFGGRDMSRHDDGTALFNRLNDARATCDEHAFPKRQEQRRCLRRSTHIPHCRDANFLQGSFLRAHLCRRGVGHKQHPMACCSQPGDGLN